MNKKLSICINAALAGGRDILNANQSEAKTKGDLYVGDHSIVTNADFISQRAILKVIKKEDPNALFMTEEDPGDIGFAGNITENNFHLLSSSSTYIIDELDGSSSKAIGHYEWSVSIAHVDKLKHETGVVFAPEIKGGTLFYASKDEGAFISRIGKDKKIEVIDREIKDSYVIFGVDSMLIDKYPKHFKLIGDISKEVRTTNSNGSCALSMALIAAGWADALVQPLQSPWDYAAAMLILEEAGGIIKFYEMDEEGKCFPIEKLELKHYNPIKRNVGFIAGNKKIVPFIEERLFN